MRVQVSEARLKLQKAILFPSRVRVSRRPVLRKRLVLLLEEEFEAQSWLYRHNPDNPYQPEAIQPCSNRSLVQQFRDQEPQRTQEPHWMAEELFFHR